MTKNIEITISTNFIILRTLGNAQISLLLRDYLILTEAC